MYNAHPRLSLFVLHDKEAFGEKVDTKLFLVWGNIQWIK